MTIIKFVNIVRKTIFALFVMVVLALSFAFGYFVYLDRKVRKLNEIFMGDYGYTYRESTLQNYRWQHLGKHIIDDVKNKRYSLEDALLQLELGGISIQQMDSIAGDSSWRIRDAEILKKDGTISKVKVW